MVRNLIVAVSLFSLSLLVACSGQQFSLQTTTSEGQEDAVHIGANGLPSMADLMKAGPLGERWQGKENAPVTVIEYVSLTCPHCRAFHKNTYKRFKRDYIDTGKVRYIIREFPIGRSAGNAAILTRCGDPKTYFQKVGLLLDNQSKWVSQDVRLDAIYSAAKQSGIKRSEFDKCLKNQDIINGLNWVKDRGRKLGVSGTPTFFINGQKVRKPITFKELRQIIDPKLS